MPTPLLILFTAIASIIIVLTILGNLLVLCFKARVGRTNTTLFVWNLGLTDFLVGIFVLPLGVLHIVTNEWLFGRIICRLWVAADVTFCTCSVVKNTAPFCFFPLISIHFLTLLKIDYCFITGKKR